MIFLVSCDSLVAENDPCWWIKTRLNPDQPYELAGCRARRSEKKTFQLAPGIVLPSNGNQIGKLHGHGWKQTNENPYERADDRRRWYIMNCERFEDFVGGGRMEEMECCVIVLREVEKDRDQ